MRSWQVGYRDLLPPEYLAQLRPEDRAWKYEFSGADPNAPRTIVGIIDGGIRGFATVAPARDPNLPGYGELCALYVDPDYWRRGLGKALLAASCAHLLESGIEHAMIWVLRGNTRALRFYQREGWMPDGAQRAAEVWGIKVNEVRYVRDLP